jgi:putative transposase
MLKEADLWISEGFPVTRTMKSLGIERSLYYYHQDKPTFEEIGSRGRPVPGYSLNKNGEKIPDEQIEEFLMEAVEGEEVVYGYRKLTHFLRNEHNLEINPKKVYRLCDKLDILLPKREKKTKYPRRIARNHVITGPNQLWQLDIKYGSIEDSGRFFFLASAIDVFDRCIVGHYMGSSCKAKSIAGMLQEALLNRKVPLPNEENLEEVPEEEQRRLFIRTDNGPQFVSEVFGEFCESKKVIHERIPKKSPNCNAYIESFHSIIERECFQRYAFEFFEEAYFRVSEFIEFYNDRRYHGSLNYLSPTQYHELYNKGSIEIEAIKL